MKKKRYEILFEDDHLLIVNKPAFLLSIPDRYDAELPNLQDILKRRFGDIFTVHRLDKETSGAMIFAKTKEAHKSLSLDFLQNNIYKEYVAFLYGVPLEDKGVIDRPLNVKSSKVFVDEEGKNSISNYEVLEKFGQYCYVKIQIETGRTHQIRVHFQSINCPMLVDSKYGKADAFYLSSIKGRQYKKRKGDVENPLIERTSLHSHLLRFNHPHTKEEVSFTCPVPKDFKAVLYQMRKVFS